MTACAPGPAFPGPRSPDPDAVAVGEIVGAHALHGMLRVRPISPTPTLAEGRRIMLERSGLGEVDVTRGAHGPGVVLLGLDGVCDRTAAEALRGTRLLVQRADSPRWTTTSTTITTSWASPSRRSMVRDRL